MEFENWEEFAGDRFTGRQVGNTQSSRRTALTQTTCMNNNDSKLLQTAIELTKAIIYILVQPSGMIIQQHESIMASLRQ